MPEVIPSLFLNRKKFYSILQQKKFFTYPERSTTVKFLIKSNYNNILYENYTFFFMAFTFQGFYYDRHDRT